MSSLPKAEDIESNVYYMDLQKTYIHTYIQCFNLKVLSRVHIYIMNSWFVKSIRMIETGRLETYRVYRAIISLDKFHETENRMCELATYIS